MRTLSACALLVGLAACTKSPARSEVPGAYSLVTPAGEECLWVRADGTFVRQQRLGGRTTLFHGTWQFEAAGQLKDELVFNDFGPYPVGLHGQELVSSAMGSDSLVLAGLVPYERNGCIWLELAEDAQVYLRAGSCKKAGACGPVPSWSRAAGDAGAAIIELPRAK